MEMVVLSRAVAWREARTEEGVVVRGGGPWPWWGLRDWESGREVVVWVLAGVERPLIVAEV